MNTFTLATSCPANEFEHWWHSQGQWVEPPNQRRGGESGVQLLQQGGMLLYCKRQHGHLYRTLRHPLGKPTVLREIQAYQALSALGIATPRMIYGCARKRKDQWQALLVTEALHGFVSLEQWYNAADRHMASQPVLHQLALTLARLHRARWQHGCCYPKHLFVRLRPDASGAQQADIALLDLEKSRRRWRIRDASRRDLRQLERHRGNIPMADLDYFYSVYQTALNQTALNNGVATA